MAIRYRTLLYAALPGLFIIVFGLVAGLFFDIRINLTPSAPIGLWKVTGQVERGSYVMACIPPSAPMMQTAIKMHYLPDGACKGGYAPLLKKVAAIPGDTVTLTRQTVFINGKALPNTATIYEDKHGNHLKPIDRGAFFVKPGEYWLIGNQHPRSFDSRYFGAVSETAILHSMQPVLTYSGDTL